LPAVCGGVALYRLVSLTLSAVQQYFLGGWGSLWVIRMWLWQERATGGPGAKMAHKMGPYRKAGGGGSSVGAGIGDPGVERWTEQQGCGL